MGRIPARHGDTLRITVDGVQGSVDVTVDAEGPEFSEIFPEDNLYLGSQTVKFRFVVTDEDSGLRHDGELDYTRGDLDARAFNMDDDQFTNGEPRSIGPDGAAEDIDVRRSATSAWCSARRQRGREQAATAPPAGASAATGPASPTSWTWPSPTSDEGPLTGT